jgi:hypothetical protein
VNSAIGGFGFPREASQVVFPLEMFFPGSDLTPISENVDKIVEGLTKWEPELQEKGIIKPREMIAVEGKSYAQAEAKMNNLFLKSNWSDGLPLVPATKEAVDWLLTGTDLSPDTVVGAILPRGGIATVEAIAINAAMAGARPEYMPLLIAAVEGIVDPLYQQRRSTTTTCSVNPVVIVNGPMAKQIRLNSEYGALGPDPLHPAGGSIGRAIRLIMLNLGGAVPGAGTMALYGGSARYVSTVFAEDENGLPADWEPLNVERGFDPGSDTATVYAVAGNANVCCVAAGTEDAVMQSLNTFAGFMKIPNSNYFHQITWSDGAPGIMLIVDTIAQGFSDFGWSKEEVRDYLWENSKLSYEEAEKARKGRAASLGLAEGEAVPITSKAENIVLAVAGGAQGMHGYWMQAGCCDAQPVTKAIKLPANWQDLIAASEEDLGPIPSP